MQKSFWLEDSAMNRTQAPQDIKDGFELHIEAHAKTMERLAKAVDMPTPRRQYKVLIEVIEGWQQEHFATHDEPLIVWLEKKAP